MWRSLATSPPGDPTVQSPPGRATSRTSFERLLTGPVHLVAPAPSGGHTDVLDFTTALDGFSAARQLAAVDDAALAAEGDPIAGRRGS